MSECRLFLVGGAVWGIILGECGWVGMSVLFDNALHRYIFLDNQNPGGEEHFISLRNEINLFLKKILKALKSYIKTNYK